jgi:ribosomal protein S18 acetylase RimI-like enzyme
MPAVRVRPMTRGDADALHAIACQLREWFNADGLARIRHDLGAQEGFVAETDADASPAGFVLFAVRPDGAEMTWLAVARSLHGQGIGTSLCAELETALAARGVRVIEVSTLAETIDYAPYEATRRFYVRRGYRPVRVDVAYWGPENDRLLLRKELPRP